MPRSILRSVGKANRASCFFRPPLEILSLAHCSGIYWFLGCPSVFDILVLFATFRIVGRIWRPAIPCPQCAYLNDDTYNFCQRCGFRKAVIPTPDSSSSISVDLKSINDRLAELKRTKSAKPYSSTHSQASPFCLFFGHLEVSYMERQVGSH